MGLFEPVRKQVGKPRKESPLAVVFRLRTMLLEVGENPDDPPAFESRLALRQGWA